MAGVALFIINNNKAVAAITHPYPVSLIYLHSQCKYAGKALQLAIMGYRSVFYIYPFKATVCNKRPNVAIFIQGHNPN